MLYIYCQIDASNRLAQYGAKKTGNVRIDQWEFPVAGRTGNSKRIQCIDSQLRRRHAFIPRGGGTRNEPKDVHAGG